MISDLKHHAAVAFVAILVFVFMYANPFSGDDLLPRGGGSPTGGEVTACNGAPLELPAAQRELLELHNETRAENGVPELCYQGNLADAAQSHSQDMLERVYFSHKPPQGRGAADRMLAAVYVQDGYRSWQVAENIYKISGPGRLRIDVCDSWVLLGLRNASRAAIGVFSAVAVWHASAPCTVK